MSFPTAVNSQITDAVHLPNTQVVGDASIPVAKLLMSLSQSLSLAAANAVNAQQQGYMLLQAETTQIVATLLQTPTATDAAPAAQPALAVAEPEAPQSDVGSIADAGAAA